MPDCQLLIGDCVERMADLPDASVDSIITDPPYGLGFMGKKWDIGVPAVDVFAECLRVLKPGGHLLAFGGSRTYHRLAVAVEDAGFEIRDQIMWVYGSGFPKSQNVSKAIDKAGGTSTQAQSEILRDRREQAGLSREQVAERVGCTPSSVRDWEEGRARAKGAPLEYIVPSQEYREKLADLLGYSNDERRLVGASVDRRGDKTVYGIGHTGELRTGGHTDAAKQWEGWGTALKPAHEPIVVARKPLRTDDVNVLEMVELQLRKQGVTGAIEWKPRRARTAEKPNHSPSSIRTKPQPTEAMSAEPASAFETPDSGNKTENVSENSIERSGRPILSGIEQQTEKRIDDCEQRSSQSMAESARAAASQYPTSSHSITSMAEEPHTESPSTARSTPNSDALGSQTATEFSVGIATGPHGSTETVRITRNTDGSFVWPEGLPKSIKGHILTVAANVLAHGTGALNIDGCRVGENDGRWPANLIHDGSEEVLAAFPDAKGQQGALTGNEPSGKMGRANCYGVMDRRHEAVPRIDSSTSAARFFYCAKASKKDRGEGNNHPTVKPTELMRYLCRLVTPPGGTVLDPFAGSGSTGKAAMQEGFDFIGIEKEAEYLPIIRARLEQAKAGSGD